MEQKNFAAQARKTPFQQPFFARTTEKKSCLIE